jgi:hypothetical protein
MYAELHADAWLLAIAAGIQRVIYLPCEGAYCVGCGELGQVASMRRAAKRAEHAKTAYVHICAELHNRLVAQVLAGKAVNTSCSMHAAAVSCPCRAAAAPPSSLTI